MIILIGINATNKLHKEYLSKIDKILNRHRNKYVKTTLVTYTKNIYNKNPRKFNRITKTRRKNPIKHPLFPTLMNYLLSEKLFFITVIIYVSSTRMLRVFINEYRKASCIYGSLKKVCTIDRINIRVYFYMLF